MGPSLCGHVNAFDRAIEQHERYPGVPSTIDGAERSGTFPSPSLALGLYLEQDATAEEAPMGFLGIVNTNEQDPVRAVLADANELGGYGHQLISVVNDIDKRIQGSGWTGDDRIGFEKDWSSEVKPELESLARLMQSKADELTQLAYTQKRASQAI